MKSWLDTYTVEEVEQAHFFQPETELELQKPSPSFDFSSSCQVEPSLQSPHFKSTANAYNFYTQLSLKHNQFLDLVLIFSSFQGFDCVKNADFRLDKPWKKLGWAFQIQALDFPSPEPIY